MTKKPKTYSERYVNNLKRRIAALESLLNTYSVRVHELVKSEKGLQEANALYHEELKRLWNELVGWLEEEDQYDPVAQLKSIVRAMHKANRVEL